MIFGMKDMTLCNEMLLSKLFSAGHRQILKNVIGNGTIMMLIDAAYQKPTAHTPVWLMRQAGRYMKEYRDLRKKVTFLELCKSPELVCETTVFAQETIHADAAIIFADILLILEPLGFDLEFAKNHGPVIHNPYTPDFAFEASNMAQSLQYVGDAIRMTRAALQPDIALIGFAGAPFTVATYAIEGGKSKDFSHVKSMLKDHKEAFQRLLTKLTDGTIAYLKMQVEAGANCIQLFDSWVSLLSAQDYQELVQPHVTRIFEAIAEVPTIYFGTKSGPLLHNMMQTKPTVMGLDADVRIREIWPALDHHPIQGNLNPELLADDFEQAIAQTDQILADVQKRPGFIFNLGHGILPHTHVDNVIRLIDHVHEKTS